MNGSHNTLPLILASFLALTMPAAQAADGKLSLSTGFDYSSGSYGQSQDTNITYIPVTGKYATGPWTFGLTVPWIEVEGPGNVVREVGRFGQARTTTATRTESGLGDLVASATYNLMSTADGRALDFTAKYKFGTADRDKGLGTGEDDVYVQLDAYRQIDRFTPFATIGYKMLGDPPGVDLKNVFFGEIGGSYKLDDIRSVGAMWYGQQKTSTVGDVQNELTGFYIQRLSADWRGQAYGVLGLSDGSPDYALGIAVTRAF